MKTKCEYCDYRDTKSGWKEMNTPLLEYDTELAGHSIWIVAIIQDGYLQLDGENTTMDKLKINYCPVCGRRLNIDISCATDVV